MSKSRKKSPVKTYANAGSMKAWKKQENRRYRAFCKQLVNFKDWNSVSIPKIQRFSDYYGSPKDGQGGYQIHSPCECQFEAEKGFWGKDGEWHLYSHYVLNDEGHNKYCDSKFNPKSRYWKVFRK